MLSSNARWTQTDDDTILASVRELGSQWDAIAAQLPGRTADSIRNRCHRLEKKQDMHIDKGQQRKRKMDDRLGWTDEDDRTLAEGVARFGCKWRDIACLLPGRSDSSIRNRWMRKLHTTERNLHTTERKRHRRDQAKAPEPAWQAFLNAILAEADTMDNGIMRFGPFADPAGAASSDPSIRNWRTIHPMPQVPNSPGPMIDLQELSENVEFCDIVDSLCI